VPSVAAPTPDVMLGGFFSDRAGFLTIHSSAKSE
jgi:hypothetical protein